MNEILAAAQTALGGATKIAAVKTLVVTGRTQQLRGNNLVPIEFEINVELPDRYIRRDEIPAQDGEMTESPDSAFDGQMAVRQMARFSIPCVLSSRALATVVELQIEDLRLQIEKHRVARRAFRGRRT